MTTPRCPCHPGRRGVVLVVVLTLLALFAVVGIGFVFLAEQQSVSAQAFKASENRTRPDADLLLGFFLNRWVFDTDDSDSALLGQGLMRNMYGLAGSQPFNGSGKLHTNHPTLGDLYYVINYTVPRNPINPAQALLVSNPELFGAFNPAYTYPDQNAPYLGALRSDGIILARSFVRPVRLRRADGFLLDFDPYDPANASFWSDPSPNYQPPQPPPPGGVPPITLTHDQRRGMVLRPLPWDTTKCMMDAQGKPLFPGPEDEGGDVRNLHGVTGVRVVLPNGAVIFPQNDSYWFDPNFPVQIGPDGKHYKPLFAVFIKDLDGKLNVNAHFNDLGAAADPHLSNMGLGSWEVGPPTGAADVASFRQEFVNLLRGTANPAIPGRYRDSPGTGLPGFPGQSLLGSFPAGPFYGLVDLNGRREGSQQRTPLMTLPTGHSVAFPTYPPGWENGLETNSPSVRLNHPALYHPFNPAPADGRFHPMHLELPYRMGDTGTDALVSDILRLCPQSFAGGQYNRLRWMLTTTSHDRATYGHAPWFYPGPTGEYYLTLNPDETAPKAPPPPYPPAPIAASPPWQAPRLAAINRRIAFLNRPLANNYPLPTLNGRLDLSNPLVVTAYNAAVAERVARATVLYRVLIEATGAADPFTVMPTVPQLDALRWLAQLAINIVDFTDGDDYLTPFNWGTIGSPAFQVAHGGEWVFGTETPRLVLNELYSEIRNNPSDPGLALDPPLATLPYQVNFWTEFQNPFRADASVSDNGTARLQMPDSAANAGDSYGVHQLVISQAPDAGLRVPGNARGNPDPLRVIRTVSSFIPENDPAVPAPLPGVDTNVVLPVSGAYSGTQGKNEGFYIAGPKYDFPGGQVTPTLRVKDLTTMGGGSMTYDLPANTPLANPPSHAILLRRLACPTLPPQNDPAQPFYNPYVTVDYLEDVPLNDGVDADANGSHMAKKPVDQRAATARRQPYTAHQTQLAIYEGPMPVDRRPIPPNMNQPQHTLFRQNAREAVPPPSAATQAQTMAIPFDWLVHLDRPLANPMELLHVSGFKPHELTQQFMLGGGRFQHLAPWFDANPAANTRLWRFLEYVECRPLSQWTDAGTVLERRAGKLNINTIWDAEIFLGWADMPEYFDPNTGKAELLNLWTKLAKQRDGTPVKLTDDGFRVGNPNSKPLWGLGTGPHAGTGSNGTTGLEDTWLRTQGDDEPLLTLSNTPGGLPSNHPYDRYRLVSKLSNNLTTRSNVFAVWVTAGFFEVDSQGRLGAEIGRSEGKHVRHRMFAIVDRSPFDRHHPPDPSLDPRRDYQSLGGPPAVVIHSSIIE